jgi:cytochrome c553
MRNAILGDALALLLPYQGPLQAGGSAAGEGAFNAGGCVGWRGVSGKAPIRPDYPIGGGEGAGFIAGELHGLRSGEGREPTMNAMAAMLGDTDIANLSAYPAAQ